MFFKPKFPPELLNSLFRYGCSLCHDQDQAYDLVQQCCEKILSAKKMQLSLFRGDNLKKYAMVMLRNIYIDSYRRAKLELVVSTTLETDAQAQHEEVLRGLDDIMIDQQSIDILLDNLNDEERELLFLWAVEGYSMTEISQLLTVPRGTILSRLSRLKKRLVQQFPQFVDRVV